MAGDDERLQQSGDTEMKPLTHENLAHLNKILQAEMTWPHMAGDEERLQQIGAAEVKPLTCNNLAQLNTFFNGTTDPFRTIQAGHKVSRCASCKLYLLRGPKCVFCKQLLFEGLHYQQPLWNLVSALNEQFPEDRPQCIKAEDSHEQPHSHARAAQEFEMSRLECANHCVAHQSPQQAGQESDNSAHKLVRRSFCTQKCMLGLVRHLELDTACPNVTAHRQGLETDSHQINYLELSSLLTSQLALDPNNGCTPLALGTLPGRLHSIDKHVIFRITLISHGYTLVGKATQLTTVRRLRREREAYLVLRKMQGKKVPVLLGDFYLVEPWSLSPEDVGPHSGSEMVYMLLLSHVGRPISSDETQRRCNIGEIRKFCKDMRGKGIQLEPNEIRTRNMIWNKELERLMFIDFERVNFSNRWTAVISENGREDEMYGSE
ncbi:MAG: hypothetical protein OHK93_005397 [Ramalina farinacea]|uniref:Uncharacterized protein n=1 Tax=Ramalina farinacea TaxID=258253 RepID=A0AA43U1A2_9LECA|nr:hypothetical protein [Ramalina farinacea]